MLWTIDFYFKIKSNYLATNTEPKFLNGEDLKFKNYSGEDKLVIFDSF